MLIEAAGQSISLAGSSSLDLTILFAIYSAFCRARLFACFKIFLFCSNCAITVTNKVLSSSTFFSYSLRVLSNDA
jgi:hypothetical protein